MLQKCQSLSHWVSSQINTIFLYRDLSYVKPESIFQICREKFFEKFREKLDRVTPCPSTWHKYENIKQKIQNKSHSSVWLNWLIMIAITHHKIKRIKSYEKCLVFCKLNLYKLMLKIIFYKALINWNDLLAFKLFKNAIYKFFKYKYWPISKISTY